MTNSNYSLGNPNNTFFSLNLKRRRLELGISKEELASELGITVSDLDRYEGINHVHTAIPNEVMVAKIKNIFNRVNRQNHKQILDTIIARAKNPTFLMFKYNNILQTSWQNVSSDYAMG